MGVIKSFSVGDGDMFYIRHGNDNFTVIDCCNYIEGRKINTKLFTAHLNEIEIQSKDKGIKRFISTHPDDDHISGLCDYDNKFGIINFYCVKNNATKDDESEDFERYCSLRDSNKSFYLYSGCSRKWLNENNEERGSSGINCLWPIITNQDYKEALEDAENGGSPNNISPILTYSADNITFMWMGDIESDFLDKVKNRINFKEITILFAPHHGRDSGKVPEDVLKKLNPKIIIIGEAPSENLNYYPGYNIITQISAGDIVFETCSNGVNVYTENEDYKRDFLAFDDNCYDAYGCHYIGTLEV